MCERESDTFRLLSCPRCGHLLDMDPDGGYCPNCDDYWPIADLAEHEEEEN
jgi:rubrerythrin